MGVGTSLSVICAVSQHPHTPEMFHPPKIPQQQRNSNRTGFQWVPIANPLNADVPPVVDPLFSHCLPLLAVVVPTTVVGNATGSLILLI